MKTLVIAIVGNSLIKDARHLTAWASPAFATCWRRSERKAIHNLKYYTWVEQQGKTAAELTEQWRPEYWRGLFEDEVNYFDQLIEEFNREVGALA